jgi:hypothetical protein
MSTWSALRGPPRHCRVRDVTGAKPSRALHATIPNLQDMARPTSGDGRSLRLPTTAHIAAGEANLPTLGPSRRSCHGRVFSQADGTGHSHFKPNTGRRSCPTRPDPFTALGRSRLVPSAIQVGSRLLEKFYGAPGPPLAPSTRAAVTPLFGNGARQEFAASNERLTNSTRSGFSQVDSGTAV